jgi:hypothetical protein
VDRAIRTSATRAQARVDVLVIRPVGGSLVGLWGVSFLVRCPLVADVIAPAKKEIVN